MKFLDGHRPDYDLTYDDVFFVPQFSEIGSRFDVDLSAADGTGNTTPLIVANMNAVAGRRMAETVARRGGIVALPQDLSPERLTTIIREVKSADPHRDTPLTLTAHDKVRDAAEIIHKRAHGAIIIIDEERRPIGVLTESDWKKEKPNTSIGDIVLPEPVCADVRMTPSESYAFLKQNRLKVAPVVKEKQLVGIITEKSAIRSDIYTPNVDEDGRLRVIATIGINGDTEQKTIAALEAGADLLMVDTAHGHQISMLRALKIARKVAGSDIRIIAGNVVTAEGTRDLIGAGADIVKVGVGPGAMCTTRMMTGVGRPQFSAILDCAAEAHKTKHHVLADGGVRHPRDVALAIAAGAANVMIGSWFAGTYESTADIEQDERGLYKKNFGMASNRAVKDRHSGLTSFEQAKKELYNEGISDSRMYLDPEMPGVEDIIDHIVAGLRSACTYAGARNLVELQENAVIGIQSAAGFQEGRPLHVSW